MYNFTMAFIQHTYDKICTITFDNVKIIYKLSSMDESVATIESEYYLIQHMSKIDDIFKTFDNFLCQDIINDEIVFPFLEHNIPYSLAKLFDNHEERFNNNKMTMMYSMLNPKLVTLFKYMSDYNHSSIENIYKILHVIHEIFRPNNFIHGDCKLDNIMIDTIDNSLKIIDLEFSFLCQDINKISNENEYLIVLYLGENLILNKRYLQLFDIYIMCASLIVCHFIFHLDILREIKNKIINNEIINETMMDFAVIYSYLFSLGRKKILDNNGVIIGTYDFINKILLKKNEIKINDLFENHVIKIQNVIKENIAFN